MKKDEIVNEWVRKAEGDYKTVLDLKAKRRKIQNYIIAFHSQQCIEKYLKAVLVVLEIKFPKQHDLELLLSLILQKDSLLAPIRNELKELTPYAVESRYPGEDVTPEETSGAVKSMKRLRKILRERLGIGTT